MAACLLFYLLIAPSPGLSSDIISLDEIYSLINRTSGLLERMVCENPTSALCKQYRQDGQISSNPMARKWMGVINEVEVEVRNRDGLALWNYITNMTEYNIEENHRIISVTGHLSSLILDQTKAIDVDQPGLDPRTKRMYDFYGSDLFTFYDASKLRYLVYIVLYFYINLSHTRPITMVLRSWPLGKTRPVA
ncbi:uncharacterized protein LOC115929932 [Strongylocentrotus purpuratus]|uniref:Uncharacterized protein n=1 Tax=Strongylocentrotus purpuratus TaxID=7668 RepID=A0A7M7PTU1_STRPU|nr:uncharacterized protein LOC115929932 [Strongylocentrotus purpuratus]